MCEQKYYCYRHIRLDKNEVFYIGIGTKQKIYNHHRTEYGRAFSKYKRSFWWHNIIKKTSYEVEIIFESNDWNEICEKEIEFIKLYGRRDLKLGTLVNLTDGGEGFKKNHSEKSKQQIRDFFENKSYEKLFGKEKALEEKRKRSEGMKRYYQNNKEKYLKRGEKIKLTYRNKSLEEKELIRQNIIQSLKQKTKN